MRTKYRFVKLPLIDRLRTCWSILSNKEFYFMAVEKRYDDGKPLEICVYSNIRNTKTAAIKLRNELNNYIKYFRR